MRSIGLLFKVLWSPGEVMFQLSKQPRVLAPMVFLCLCSVLTGTLIMRQLDFGDMTMRLIEKSRQGANLTDEQKTAMRTTMNSPVVKGVTFVSSFIVPLFVIVLVAGVYFLMFTLVGREGGFKAFFSVTAFAFVPGIVSQLASVLRAYTVPSSSLMFDEIGSLSAAVFVDRDAVSPVVFTLANSLDVVSIWMLSLMVIGYGFLARKSVSKGTRVIAVLVPYLLWIAFRVGSAAIRGV